MNTFGRHFRLTTFGESHGAYIGGVIDGCSAGLNISMEHVESMLLRRKSSGGVSTERMEEDMPHFISGILDGVTTGTPIAFLIPNKDKKSKDYDELKEVYRPSHADFTYQAKYVIRDHKGGGRSSARETVVRVVAGAIAMQLLQREGVEIIAYTSQLGRVGLEDGYIIDAHHCVSKVGCPVSSVDDEMYQALQDARVEGDTLGGVASVVVRGVPVGWGSPIYGKLDAKLADAMLGINACKGFEMGDGFGLSSMRGSEANDSFTSANGQVRMTTNHSGGVLGGISSGSPLTFRAAFKPIASIAKPQQTITQAGEPMELQIKGRHDGSVFPRVLPIIEAMTALVLVDEMLADRLSR